jgi:hypothetical protein
MLIENSCWFYLFRSSKLKDSEVANGNMTGILRQRETRPGSKFLMIAAIRYF